MKQRDYKESRTNDDILTQAIQCRIDKIRKVESAEDLVNSELNKQIVSIYK